MTSRTNTAPLPSAIYVWIVPSESQLEQPGSWRIRMWDTKPFPEANFTASNGPSEREATLQWCLSKAYDGCVDVLHIHAELTRIKNAAPQVPTTASGTADIGTLGSERGAPPARAASEAGDSGALTPLERYALAVLDAHREEIGDLDGAFLQDLAEECGLLYYVDVTKPCGDYCRCAEYGDFPQQCLRLKKEFEPKMSLVRQSATEGAAK